MFILDLPPLRVGLREGLSNPDAVKDRTALFNKIDANHNGIINEHQFVVNMMRENANMSRKVAEQLFANLNRNHDRVLRRDEFENIYLFINQEQFRGGRLGTNPLADDLLNLVKQIFAMDRGSRPDGIITDTEFRQSQPNGDIEDFHRSDLNGDGKVEVVEAIARVEMGLPLDNDTENNRLHGISSRTIAEIDPDRIELMAAKLQKILDPHNILANDFRNQALLYYAFRDSEDLFSYVDTNENGIISQNQLKKGLQDGFNYSNELATRLASEIFKAGNDGDIYLTRNELISLCRFLGVFF